MQYHNYEEIQSIPDRLKWCRHHLGLEQEEVAKKIGVSRAIYQTWESGILDYYNKDIVDQLSSLYKIPVDDLLDDYNRFMHYGQGKAIRTYLESLGIGKRTFARLLNLNITTYRLWESEQVRITKTSWEKYFKDRIKI